MEPTAGGLWAAACAVVVHAIVLFFKSPKEVSNEQGKKLETLETNHNQLKNEFIAVTTRLTTEINHLANTVKELSDTIRAGIGVPPRHVKR